MKLGRLKTKQDYLSRTRIEPNSLHKRSKPHANVFQPCKFVFHTKSGLSYKYNAHWVASKYAVSFVYFIQNIYIALEVRAKKLFPLLCCYVY